MENTERAAVVAGDFRWSDIGSWDALFEITAPDAAGNVLHGDGRDARRSDCVVHSDDRLTAVVGRQDLVVVTPRRRDGGAARTGAGSARTGRQAQGRKKARGDRSPAQPPAVGLLRMHRHGRALSGQAHRGDPGRRLSLQKHRHRAEHWVVVRGTAEVTVGERSARSMKTSWSISRSAACTAWPTRAKSRSN